MKAEVGELPEPRLPLSHVRWHAGYVTSPSNVGMPLERRVRAPQDEIIFFAKTSALFTKQISHLVIFTLLFGNFYLQILFLACHNLFNGDFPKISRVINFLIPVLCEILITIH